jgi:hypothetical protein
MTRRIGLDLDNTIIDYALPLAAALEREGVDVAPHPDRAPSKQDAKRAVLDRNGDEGWQRVQGWIYSTGIELAEAFPGVHEFLVRCAAAGDEVHIVSHKTERGHFDASGRSLRDAATSWLRAHGVVGEEPWQVALDHVHYEPTQDAKVAHIASLGVAVYVDDLSEVLRHPSFPSSVRGLKFGVDDDCDGLEVVGSWREAADAVHGAVEPTDVGRMLGCLGAVTVAGPVHPIGAGGNSRVFVLNEPTGRIVAKRYPDRHRDRRNRCRTEVLAAQWMHGHGLPVARPLWWDDRVGLATFECVDGVPSPSPDSALVDAMLALTERLASLGGAASTDFGNASEACLSLDDLVGQVQSRIDAAARSSWVPLAELATSRLQRELDEAAAAVAAAWPAPSHEPLPRTECVLSPSDFGSHNAIRTAHGDVFLDFEYFGWDDPAKLVGDVLLHPGMALDRDLRQRWWAGCTSVFGPLAMERARIALPLLALRWNLIVLRPFFGVGPFDELTWVERCARAERLRSTAVESPA